MTVPADDELLRRSAGGDPRAFEVLVDRHAASVHHMLRSMGASDADAEDALQECFVSAWSSAGSFRGEGSARGWLYAIARNALRRHHRRRVGEPATLESLEVLGERAGWGSTHDFESRFEASDTLEWALDRLPVEEREVIVLRDLMELDGREAASVLGLSVGAMKSRLHRGRLRLLAVLRGVEGGE